MLLGQGLIYPLLMVDSITIPTLWGLSGQEMGNVVREIHAFNVNVGKPQFYAFI